YKLKLAAFASLGYLYVAGVLLALIAASGALVASLLVGKGLVLLVKKALIPLVVLIGVVLKSLWVKLEPPQGIRLERRHHPRLFAAIDEVRIMRIRAHMPICELPICELTWSRRTRRGVRRAPTSAPSRPELACSVGR